MSNLNARDGEIKNNWYIACTSKELKQKPIQRTIYDEKLVLFRDEKNKPAAMPDRCLHRASLLSAGTVVAGKLVCPYHGWSYNRGGEVVRVPSEGPEGLKGRRCASARPTVEKNGVVWVWMGRPAEADELKIWEFPHDGEKGWSHYFMVTDFENEVTNLVENFIDVPHTISVHKGWFRNETHQQVPFTTETKDGNVLVTYHQPNDGIGVLIKPLLNPFNEPMEHTDRFIYPNITRVDYSFGARFKYVINSQCTPVSTMNTRVYTWIAYKLPLIGEILKPFIHFYTRQVINQDVWIMQIQKQNLDVNEKPQFQSTPADEPHLQIERLRELGVSDEKRVWEVEKVVENDIWI